MSTDTVLGGGSKQRDLLPVQSALGLLRRACDKAIEELGGSVPGVQLRALLVIDETGGVLDLRQLALELGASASAASMVRDRMEAAGLLTPEGDASTPGSQPCVLTDSGRRLACWIKDRQRAAVSDVLDSMRPQARDELVHGLTELATAAQEPS